MTTLVNQPRVNVSIANANQNVQNTDQVILFVGQKLPAGTATSGDLVQDVANGGAEGGLFAPDSMLATMIRANKVRNQQIRVDAIALDDNGGGVAATGDITVAGSATEAGTYEVIIGSERNHSFSISVASGDTATTVGDAIEAAITADNTVLVTASNSAGTVTMTAKNAGTFGNSIALEIRGTIAGLTTSVTGMASGATDPVLTGVFDVIGNRRYQAIVWPYPDDTSEVLTLLDSRFNADGSVLDGVAFTAKSDTFSNLQTLGNGLNSQSLVIIGNKQETETNYSGPSIVEVPMVIASQYAGFRALRLDSGGFNISDLVVTTNGPLDSFGGPALASKPYFNTPFDELIPMQVQRGFTDTEVESLFDSGISVIGNNPSNNTVIAGESVSSYKTDTGGSPDITFKFLNYIDTASQIREYYFNNLRARFAQTRLTEGDIVKGRDQSNEIVIRTYAKQLYGDLSGPDFVLVEAGDDALTFFEQNLIVSIDKANGKVTIQMTVPIVTQIREINVTIKIAFSTQV